MTATGRRSVFIVVEGDPPPAVGLRAWDEVRLPDRVAMNGVDLERQNKEPRRLLYEQWETNHHEHCGKVGDHADCYWPLPEVLTPPQMDTNH